MDYCEGGDLAGKIKSARPGQGDAVVTWLAEATIGIATKEIRRWDSVPQVTWIYHDLSILIRTCSHLAHPISTVTSPEEDHFFGGP